MQKQLIPICVPEFVFGGAILEPERGKTKDTLQNKIGSWPNHETAAKTAERGSYERNFP